MSLGDSSRRREGTSRGPHGILVGAGLRPSTLPPSRGFPGGGESVAGPEEAPAASPLLEDLRRRLRAAPRGVSRRSREEEAAEAAREEQSRARVESALARLRAELLEMHFQNCQLARTLLDLNMKMQQLKKYELEIASELQSSEDNVVNME
ncbi:alanine and arginine-rich domain-containing protein [Neophocaena asiaeorientalis asiaeorientalis]|uniref:Alanine and arginine-rich domain-containing protein n=1 Tax=Neophocaena asiaeorientalis asiaeorientalis TaxID=1706337 RepID=A0A341B2M3_NEOAA|nr:alanine and arginine-rich domain-containing protein [Neophocaena asiaeorientalis asiaeorientalis]